MNRWVLIALAGVCANGVALGEARAAEPPDLVRLKNGGMIRGTIQEYVPGDYVVIKLPNGEERRIAGDQVEQAGPAEAREAAPAPAPAPEHPASAAAPSPQVIARVKEDQAPVHFTHEGDEPIAFHVRTGTQTGTISGGWGRTISADSYEQICSAPCTADLQKGTHKLALSRSDGKPIGVSELVTVDGPSTVSGTYESFAGMRTAGWIMAVAGGALAIGGTFASYNDCEGDPYCDSLNEGVLVGTVAGGMVLLLTGYFFTVKSDEATLTVQPGVAAGRSHRSVAYEPAARGTPLGLTGAIQF
jgi:hypothetical protein